jgi:GntR family transcriptional regulator
LRPTVKTTAGRDATLIDFNRSAVSRYIQLATLFRRRIETGQWAVGAQIPTVDVLAEEFSVARATIRQALATLEADGLIERHRAKGTFVLFRPQQGLWCEVETDWTGLLKSRDGAKIEVLSETKTGDVEGRIHDIGTPAERYWHLRRRHWRDGSAFLIAEVFIDDRLRPRIPRAALKTKSSMRLIADVAGVHVADARQTLTISTADSETAQLLDIALNAPVAIVHRCAVDQNGTLVFVGIGVYRGDVVRLDLKLR